MYETMVRKQYRSGALVLCLLLSAAALPALEKTIELGRDNLWTGMQTMDGVVTLPGRWGFRDLALSDGAYVPDTATDLLLHFDDASSTDATGAWKMEAAPVLAAESAHGGASAAFTGGRRGIVLHQQPGSLFSAGAAWGDFSIEFWLFPATLADGETILSWNASARDAPGGPLIGQTLLATIRDRRVIWDFRNLFRLPTGERLPVTLVGTRQLLPRAWHHHLLRFDSREGLLEYAIDGVPEAILHATDTGHETGSIAVPEVGTAYAGPLVLGPGYTGMIDELRVSQRFVDDPVVTRYLGRTGAATSRIIDLGFSSTRVTRIDAVDVTPSDSAVEFYYQAADTWNGKNLLKGDTDWIPFTPGADLGDTIRARYLQLRVELYPDGTRTASPRVSSLAVVYEPNTPPSAPAGISATPGNGKVTLTWRPVNDPNVRGYLVYYGNSPHNYLGTGASPGDSPIDVGTQTTLEIAGLANGSLYYFTVAAYDNSTPRQQSDFGSEVSARPSRIYK
jgi:hypothetical protein